MNKLVFTFLLIFTVTIFASKVKDNDGLQVGDKMADFGLKQVDLTTGKLSKFVWLTDFVGKNGIKAPKKLLMLSFFANWCEPCIAEMDILEKFYTKYSSAGLMVLGINFRTADEKFKETIKGSVKILKNKKVTYPVLFDRFTNRNQLLYLGFKAKLPCIIFLNILLNLIFLVDIFECLQ